MLDIETMDNKPGAALTQIAAVGFDRYSGPISHLQFNEKITLKSSMSHGLTASPDTILWWMVQSNEAKNIFKNGHSLTAVLESFSRWFKKNDFTYIWGNGSIFDNNLLQVAYDTVKIKYPWTYKVHQDLRTLVDIAEIDPKSIEFDGTPHDAIDDCLHQIKIANICFNKL